jgi:(p)ppGpp synthase/HD superfamily hydrolase
MKTTPIENNLIICGKLHADTNHTYDDMPYIYHLDMVVSMGEKFIHLIPEQDREIVLTACAGHDLIEDARLTYNDVNKLFGERVAVIVYALTNEKGKNRAERANDKYYEGIRTTEYAPFVKLCDRLANASHSKMKKSRMVDMYRKENDGFIGKVLPKDHNLSEMVDELVKLFKS